jgi:hypothetical protein
MFKERKAALLSTLSPYWAYDQAARESIFHFILSYANTIISHPPFAQQVATALALKDALVVVQNYQTLGSLLDAIRAEHTSQQIALSINLFRKAHGQANGPATAAATPQQQEQ